MTTLSGRYEVQANASGLLVRGSLLDTEVSVICPTNALCVDQNFFVANRTYQVVDVRYLHTTAGTDAGAVNLQLTKETGTQAPGAGTDLLTNNTNAGFNCKATANTVQVGTLITTTPDLTLSAGDRLSLDFAGTVTALAGVTVTVSLRRV